MTRRILDAEALAEIAEAAIRGENLSEADIAALAEAYLQAACLVERLRTTLRPSPRTLPIEVRP